MCLSVKEFEREGRGTHFCKIHHDVPLGAAESVDEAKIPASEASEWMFRKLDEMVNLDVREEI
jgi:hypothetical protein